MEHLQRDSNRVATLRESQCCCAEASATACGLVKSARAPPPDPCVRRDSPLLWDARGASDHVGHADRRGRVCPSECPVPNEAATPGGSDGCHRWPARRVHIAGSCSLVGIARITDSGGRIRRLSNSGRAVRTGQPERDARLGSLMRCAPRSVTSATPGATHLDETTEAECQQPRTLTPWRRAGFRRAGARLLAVRMRLLVRRAPRPPVLARRCALEHRAGEHTGEVRSPANGRVGMYCDPGPLAMCAQSWLITCASWSMRVGGRYWWVTRAAKGDSASSMALVMAAGAPIIPPSPMPRKSFSPGLSVWR
jgi:hypothetical protein